MSARHHRTVALAVLTLMLGACTVKRHAGDKTVEQLFAKPWDFNGKRVAVIGYYASGLEESSLRAAPDDWDHGMIWVDLGWRGWYLKRVENRHVRAVGTFHYRPEERRTIEKRDDGREFESIQPLGFGHMGLYPAELSDITSFRPLR